MNQPNQGRGYGPTLNTNMSLMYSNDGRLKIGLWNERLTIEINPLTTGPTGNRTYSNENTVKITITKSEAIVLLKAIDTILTEHASEVNVPTGFGDSKKLIGLSKSSDGNIVLKLYTHKTANGEIDTSFFTSHVFRTNVYDADGETITVMTDFMEFANRVREFTNETVASNHAYRYGELVRQSYAQQANNKGGSYNNSSNSGGYRAVQSTYDGNDLSFLPSEGSLDDLPF